MSSFAPKFCPTHLKIHVCDLQNLYKKNKKIEQHIGAKVRRLHGTQTPEELAKEAEKNKPIPGTLADILSKAKAKIAENKKDLNINPSNQENTPPTAEEINNRVAALRAKALGESVSSPTQEISKDIALIENKNSKIDKNNSKKTVKTTNKSNKKVNSPSNSGQSSNKKMQEEEFESIKQNNVKKAKSKPPLASEEKVFSVEETEQLIQKAVKQALKEVGIINEQTNKKSKKINTKNSKKE